MRAKRIMISAAIGLLGLATQQANAKVAEIRVVEIQSPTFDGLKFGEVAQYERIKGTIRGSIGSSRSLRRARRLLCRD
jgi:hypothetical protein